MSNFKRKIFSSFVAFSEYPNFTQMKEAHLLTKSIQKYVHSNDIDLIALIEAKQNKKGELWKCP